MTSTLNAVPPPRQPRAWSARRKSWTLGLAAAAISLALLAFLVGTGVAAALEARQQFLTLQTELSHLSPVDFIQAQTYQGLAGRFNAAEDAAGRARSRLAFVKLLGWLPGGTRLDSYYTQLEMAHDLSRAGQGLSTAFQGALAERLDEMEPEEAAQFIAEALRKETARLAQVERDLQEARQLRQRLGDEALDSRYAALLDAYLPQLQTVVYITRVSPEVIGESYVLSRELAAIGDLTGDPLQVLARAEETDASLEIIVDRSARLAGALAVARRAAQQNTDATPEIRQEVAEVAELMERGVTLLSNATAGSRGLLALTRASEEHGFLTPEFAAAARVALDEAETRLALARDESIELRAMLAEQNGGGVSSLVFGGASGVSLTSVDRLEVALQQAYEGARFLRTFLGFEGQRVYLFLGQNQQEIRATGGLIGVAAQFTFDQGQLADLRYYDSDVIDPGGPEYAQNPPAPEPLYWYLWMERLLFRDANWSPNFPAAAAQVAELYRLGTGAPVDGVITGSKDLMVDMVGMLGDIEVPGAAGPLTREQAQAYTDEVLPYPCRPEQSATRSKRCFDEDVFFALRERLTTRLSAEERAAMVKLLKGELDKQNILIHLFDPEDGALLWQLGWNGAIRPVDHDYLLVVDSSLPGHTSEGVKRLLDYQIAMPQAGQPLEARLRVRYDHAGTRQPDKVCRQSEPHYYNCYWNYFRIYTPGVASAVTTPPVPLHQGAEKLIWGYPAPDSAVLAPATDMGPAQLTEFGGFIAVEPNSVTTVPLEYSLPWSVIRATGLNSYEYRILVQKQPGMDDDRINLAVQLPPGASRLGASPAPSNAGGRWVIFDLPLTHDQEITVGFKTS